MSPLIPTSYLLTFIVGFLLGGVLVVWLVAKLFHERFLELESDLHQRFSAFEASVAGALHRHWTPAAPAARPPTASAPEAVPPTVPPI